MSDPAPAPSPTSATVEVTLSERPPSLPRTLEEAWRSRHLLVPMGMRTIGSMYGGTKLGRAWFVLRPASDVLAKLLVFGGVLGVASGGPAPYLLVLLAALLAWRLFERSLYWGTRSFDRLGRLTRKVDVPLLLVPVATLGPALVECAVYLGFVAIATVAYLFIDGELYLEIGPELLLTPVALMLAAGLSTAVSLWTSVLNAHARDVRHGLRFVLQFWLYLTPVVYPLDEIPDGLRTAAEVNPMTAVVEMSKQGLFGSGEVTALSVGSALAFIAVLTASGLYFFSRHASHFIGVDNADEEEGDELL